MPLTGRGSRRCGGIVATLALLKRSVAASMLCGVCVPMSESNLFIPMLDGTRLAATLYLPDSGNPWPALLEAYPYRKDDLATGAAEYRRLRDEGSYAVCRIDVRGTGTSEGVATAEYPPQEQDDL